MLQCWSNFFFSEKMWCFQPTLKNPHSDKLFSLGLGSILRWTCCQLIFLHSPLCLALSTRKLSPHVPWSQLYDTLRSTRTWKKQSTTWLPCEIGGQERQTAHHNLHFRTIFYTTRTRFVTLTWWICRGETGGRLLGSLLQFLRKREVFF